jgi:hypothetical protein
MFIEGGKAALLAGQGDSFGGIREPPKVRTWTEQQREVG